jgi:hypothetical protein
VRVAIRPENANDLSTCSRTLGCNFLAAAKGEIYAVTLSSWAVAKSRLSAVAAIAYISAARMPAAGRIVIKAQRSDNLP